MKKTLKEIIKYTVMIICLAILGWFGFWALVGFSEAVPTEDYAEDYEVTYPY